MGSLQYEYEWNHGRKKEHSLQCNPKHLIGGKASCCGALEGQKSPEKDQGTAPGLQSHQFATAPAGDQVSLDTADGRHPVSQEPLGVHAEKAGGCNPERGQLHQVLASMYVHLKV
jgi:hypothetical protein